MLFCIILSWHFFFPHWLTILSKLSLFSNCSFFYCSIFKGDGCLIQDYGVLEEKVKSVLEDSPQFRLTEGKKVSLSQIICVLTRFVLNRTNPICFLCRTEYYSFVGFGNKAIHRMEQRQCSRVFSWHIRIQQFQQCPSRVYRRWSNWWRCF